MNERIQQLYQSVILQHQKHPHHFEKRQTAIYQLEAYNPFCGDQFKLYFDLKDGYLNHLSFHGHGCAISKAATSIMVKHLQGKNLQEAKNTITQYFTYLNQTHQPDEQIVSDFEAFEAVQSFPERRTCADLSWTVTLDFIEQKLLLS